MRKTNLSKKCHRCGEFFEAGLMSLEFFCNKEACKKGGEYSFYHIKSTRHISSDLFDIYDLDRPRLTDQGTVVSYERVCRVCGAPLLNKNGKYSYHKRYCNEHNGSELWAKYNWGEVSKSYAREIREKNKELISRKFKKRIENSHPVTIHYYQENSKRIERDLNNLAVCEECGKLCQIYSTTSLYGKFNIKIINIHHKIPVHKLTIENIHLIWDWDNLIALCEDCHNQQDHQLKKIKEDPYIHFRKITEFLNEV